MDRQKRNRKGKSAERGTESSRSKRTTRVHGAERPNKRKDRAAGLKRLALAVSAVSAEAERISLSHAECEALLEFYVDSEQRGETARELYPSVWNHLQSCEQCRLSYVLLSEASVPGPVEPALQPSAPLAFDLPFLTHSQKDAAWISHVSSRVGGGPLRFDITLGPAWIKSIFAPPSAQFQYKGSAETHRALLFSKILSVGTRKVDVKLWVQELGDPAYVQLQVLLASSAPLPEPLRVVIRWNGHTLSDWMHQGMATFKGVDASDLQNVQDLRVEFEAGVPEPAPEETSGDSI